LPSPSVFINSVGIEATGSVHWFLELTGKLGVDHQVGHPSEIRKAEPRKQKYDRRDAALLLKLQVENRFPSIWMPSTELRDLRTLLKHRHQWVRHADASSKPTASHAACGEAKPCGAKQANTPSNRYRYRHILHIGAPSCRTCITSCARRSTNWISAWVSKPYSALGPSY
jgi:hypothetical protein